MTNTMLIADDLTGALDAGVCLLPADVLVAVGTAHANELLAAGGPAVLSVNADTRHVDAKEAASRVASLVAVALEAGARCIFKKTDSALRGNVGAELAAALEVSGATRLHFIPALPEMGRTTQGGVHLIDGVPVSKSIFGQDPFNPVAHDRVDEIIRAQADVPVTLVAQDEPVPSDAYGIVVYDAATPRAVERRVNELVGLGEARLLGGCSGAARALARALALNPARQGRASSPKNLLVVCGSVNRVSAQQCAYARAAGARCLHIGAEQKCDASWPATPEGVAFVEEVSRSWSEAPLTVVDGSDLEDLAGRLPAGCDARQEVANNVGALLANICERTPRGRLLVTGGDILLSFMREAGVEEVRPLGQVEPGIVGFEISWEGVPFVVASKSGGFGARSLFVDMAGMPAPREETVI